MHSQLLQTAASERPLTQSHCFAFNFVPLPIRLLVNARQHSPRKRRRIEIAATFVRAGSRSLFQNNPTILIADNNQNITRFDGHLLAC